jgi:hypothetical protein
MKDDKGLYYHPFPQNKRVRMYVQETGNDILFRLWNQDDPQLWEEHGWVPYQAIAQAAEIYDKKNFDPSRAYDIDVARALLEDGK